MKNGRRNTLVCNRSHLDMKLQPFFHTVSRYLAKPVGIRRMGYLKETPEQI